MNTYDPADCITYVYPGLDTQACGARFRQKSPIDNPADRPRQRPRPQPR